MSIKIMVLTLIIMFLLLLSIRERMRRKKMLRSEIIRSPLADALAQVVGTAGGIYLSVVMLVNFLELNVPSRVELISIGFEPLASISVLIAIVQPFVLRLLKR